MITYQAENWGSYYSDCQELWLEYYTEISVDKDNLKLSMDIEKYKSMEDSGILKILTARKNTKLVGFFIGLLTTHLHYKDSLCAFQDLLFVSKSQRKSTIGIRLLKEAEILFKENGADYLFFASHPSKDISSLLKYLKFRKNDTTYIKFIG